MTENSAPPSRPKRKAKALAALVLLGIGVGTGVYLWQSGAELIATAKPQLASWLDGQLGRDKAPKAVALPPAPPVAAEMPKPVPLTPEPPVALSAIEARLAQVEKSSVDATSLLRVAERLDKLEAQLREREAKRKGDVAQLLALVLLRDAMAQGSDFDAQLRALKVLAPDDADIAKGFAILKPRAITGIPTRAQLTGRFLLAETAILRADSLPNGPADSWTTRTLDRLLTLVSVRREDGVIEGTGTPAILSRIHQALASDDLKRAVAEADQLTGTARAAAQNWLDDAHARLEADQILNDWTAQAVAAAGAKL